MMDKDKLEELLEAGAVFERTLLELDDEGTTALACAGGETGI